MVVCSVEVKDAAVGSGFAMRQFQRVLVSNRGEIAVRIAKAASALGIESVGVYAPADGLSLHTRAVSEAREIGTAADPVRAYLDADAIIRTARETGCDCIHPGYGFLAENAEFARACADAGLAFVGPPPPALALFGDKVRARTLAESLGIRVVPGVGTEVASADDARSLAADLGYPVMLKAAFGGGGRGMRAVRTPDGMAEAFERCRGEAAAAFGAGALFLEKLVDRPRHIEVQNPRRRARGGHPPARARLLDPAAPSEGRGMRPGARARPGRAGAAVRRRGCTRTGGGLR